MYQSPPVHGHGGRNLVPGGTQLNNLSGGGGLLEVLDNLKEEFKTLSREVKGAKQQRDDAERKLQAQLNETLLVHDRILDLERSHTKMRDQYEDQISKLRREIELRGGNVIEKGPSFSNGSGTFFSGNVGGLGPMDIQRSYQSTQSAPSTPHSPTIGGKRSREYYGQSSQPTSAPQGMFPSLNSFPASSGVPQQAGPPPVKYLRSESGGSSSLSSQHIQQEGTKLAPPMTLSSSTMSAPRESSLSSSAASASLMAMAAEGHRHIVQEKRLFEKAPELQTSTGGKRVEEEKKKGVDWVVGHNPRVQTTMELELSHTLDHPSVVCCVRFSNDGKCLATGCNKSAQIYDAKSGNKIHSFTEDPGKGIDLYIRSVCFSPDNRILVAGAEDKTVKIWDIGQKKLRNKLLGHNLDIYSVDFSRDGRTIVSGSGDKKTKLWDIERGECIYTLGDEDGGPKDGVTSVAFSPDGKLVAAGSLDRVVRVWETATGAFVRRYEGHLDSVYSIAFSPDGRSLVSGSLDKTLKLWDLSTSRSRSKCRATFTAHTDFVLSVAFSPDGKWIISGSKDHSVMFWDPNNSSASMMVLHGHKNSVISVAVSPAGEPHFATGSGDFRAKIWKYRFSE